MSSLTSIDPDALSVLAAITAILICQSRNVEELKLIGRFIVSVGNLIVMEANQMEAQNTANNQAGEIEHINRQIEYLQKQLNHLQKR